MQASAPLLIRVLLRALLFCTLIALSCALVITGLVWLLESLTLGLQPLVGNAAAHALAGAIAFLPVILFILALTIAARRAGVRHHKAFGQGLREAVREHPWDSLGAAFFMGLTGQGRHHHRAQLLLELLRHRPAGDSQTSGTNSDREQSADEQAPPA